MGKEAWKNLKVTPDELKERLAWSLEKKMQWACCMAAEYYIRLRGKVHVSFSGGKDSQVCMHLVRISAEAVENLGGVGLYDGLSEVGILVKEKELSDEIDRLIEFYRNGDTPKPIVQGVFADTGLEFPEIRSHVKKFENIERVTPVRKFPEVIKDLGVAIGSKKVARMIRTLRDQDKVGTATYNLYKTGIKQDGTESPRWKLAKKWIKYLDAPFKINEQCCDVFKKDPWKKYRKKTGSHGISGTTVVEGAARRISYMQTGCNSYGSKTLSRPISIFTEDDIWATSEYFGFKFCEVYYDRVCEVEWKGKKVKCLIPGEKRTGCNFCMFGLQFDKGINRIQKLFFTHNKRWNYLIYKLGFDEVLDFMEEPYLPTDADVKKLHNDYLESIGVYQTDLFGNKVSR